MGGENFMQNLWPSLKNLAKKALPTLKKQGLKLAAESLMHISEGERPLAAVKKALAKRGKAAIGVVGKKGKSNKKKKKKSL